MESGQRRIEEGMMDMKNTIIITTCTSMIKNGQFLEVGESY